jgi:hypothetical protein
MLRHSLLILTICVIWGFAWVLSTLAETLGDSADVAIVSTSSYPGRFAKVEVLLKSPVPVAAFEFHINLSNPDLINFHTDSIGVDSMIVRVDTCTGPPPHGDSCWKDSMDVFAMRYCFIDTVGSLISNFGLIYCHGDTGDTNLPYCKRIKVIGFAPLNNPIPADTNYHLLFRFGVDVFCLSDTVTDRTEHFYIFPGVYNYLSGPQGNLIPFRYHTGELSVSWSLPGDATGDSVVNIGDVVFLVNYLYKEGPGSCVMEAADANADGLVDIGDVVYLINFLFKGGPPPHH